MNVVLYCECTVLTKTLHCGPLVSTSFPSMSSTTAAATIQEATLMHEDLDAESISSLTTVQASNRVSPEDKTMADNHIPHEDEEKDYDSFSFQESATIDAADSRVFDPQLQPPQEQAVQPPPPPQQAVPPPPHQVAVNQVPNDEHSGLTESEADEQWDVDLQAQREALHAQLRAVKEEQRKRRIKRNKEKSDAEEKMAKRQRRDKGDDDDDDDDDGGDGGGGGEDLKPAAVN